MSAPLLIDDSDPAVQYSAGWIHESSYPPAVDHTRHGAAKEGLCVWLTFDGTGIDVVIALDPTSQGGRPTTSYDIDGAHARTVTAPFAPDGLTHFNVTAFSTRSLRPGSHLLTITNMNGTSPNIFWLDYFLVYGPPPSRPESATTATSATSPIGSTSAPTSSILPTVSSTPTAVESFSTVESSHASLATTPLSRTSALETSSPIGTTSVASNTSFISNVPVVGSYTAPGVAPTSREPASTVASGSVPSDATDTSHRPSHSVIPAAVGGEIGAIIVISMLVALVLAIRRRNNSRRLDVDPSNRESYVSDAGWLALRSDSNASVQEEIRNAALCNSALGDGRRASGSSEYVSALQHAEGSHESLGAWHAL